MNDFAAKRRQVFLPEKYYKAMAKFLDDSCNYWSNVISSDTDEDKLDTAFRRFSNLKYKMWLLHYTAGESIDILREELESVVVAIEEDARFSAKIMGKTCMTPFHFPNIDDYERALQQISLCMLLHREDLLKRMIALIDPAYKGEDIIIEDFLSNYEEGRIDVDLLFHKKPYTILADAMYTDDDIEAAEKLRRYCKEWYPSFKQTSWHDSHLTIDGTDGNYYGYWAFEAAAVSYLYKIDDSQIDHMVYPRDLANFARNYKK